MFDDQDTQATDDTIEQHNFSFSKDSKTKIPYWYLTKIENNLRDEIIWLKSELAKRDETIAKLLEPKEIIKEVRVESKTYDGVGRSRITPTMLAHMEEVEKRKRWTKIIEENEARAKSEGNVLNVDN